MDFFATGNLEFTTVVTGLIPTGSLGVGYGPLYLGRLRHWRLGTGYERLRPRVTGFFTSGDLATGSLDHDTTVYATGGLGGTALDTGFSITGGFTTGALVRLIGRSIGTICLGFECSPSFSGYFDSTKPPRGICVKLIRFISYIQLCWRSER
ncbi:hypothetical protein PC116_g2849 [Phytophthora cactorum]|uniref:Uncharacterized protein n=1 Tax=Phytophthora cactorum TaxID=29920 RepID=A0A329SU62_9STRA|nr:hypothetical protein Pcac1_g14856 [Phytophthora cactorum]KAG2897520.1 hypothetical protein PC115_g17142 [Phytophthora cactorum]KAG2921997.1 hypothetical protein PC114_g5464 [Phytophthora cactorum]KAG2969648.1 hypothetical protein PC118_g17322 [Phytophthora cactorum]KAG3005236.1 hypothetical protein PC120_g18096 [Phytophthora cactorum]